MNTFVITITDDFFQRELTGEFQAKTKSLAIHYAKDFYAESLGTFPKHIEILRIAQVLK